MLPLSRLGGELSIFLISVNFFRFIPNSCIQPVYWWGVCLSKFPFQNGTKVFFRSESKVSYLANHWRMECQSPWVTASRPFQRDKGHGISWKNLPNTCRKILAVVIQELQVIAIVHNRTFRKNTKSPVPIQKTSPYHHIGCFTTPLVCLVSMVSLPLGPHILPDGWQATKNIATSL